MDAPSTDPFEFIDGDIVGALDIDARGVVLIRFGRRLPAGRYHLAAHRQYAEDPEPIAPPAPTPKPRVDYAPHYKPQLEQIKPGGEASIPVPLDANAASFQASIGSWCSDHWGKGSYRTMLVNGVVRVFNLLPQRQMSAMS